jgi:hypothetical protein
MINNLVKYEATRSEGDYRRKGEERDVYYSVGRRPEKIVNQQRPGE